MSLPSHASVALRWARTSDLQSSCRLRPRFTSGGIEADLTNTRIAEHEYRVVTSAISQTRDLPWLCRHIASDGELRCWVNDATADIAMLGIMGPNSRLLLEALSGADLSNSAHPFGCSCQIEIGYAPRAREPLHDLENERLRACEASLPAGLALGSDSAVAIRSGVPVLH